MSIRSEVVMRQCFFGLFTFCMVCSSGLAQVTPSKPPAARVTGQQPNVAPKTVPAPPPNSGVAAVNAAASVPDEFVIGPEDVLEIKVWREPDLTTRAVVRPDGKIGVTLLGDIQASGLTSTDLKASITSKLGRYLEQPEVSVVVVEIHSQAVHLIGFVGRPGAYTLGGPLTVVELLARAGGLAEGAKADQISIVRQKGKEYERIPFNYKEFLEGKNLRNNIQLKSGDVVVVR